MLTAFRLFSESRQFTIQVNVEVEKVQAPDPRAAKGQVAFQLWQYDGNTAQPGVGYPDAQAAEAVANIARTPYNLEEWDPLAKQVAAQFGVPWLEHIYCTMAYPGSRLYTRARDKGWDLPASWDGYSQLAYDTRPLPTNYCTPEEVLTFRDRAFQEYFSNPAYLEMIRRTFGDETELHVLEMTARPLPRAIHGGDRKVDPAPPVKVPLGGP